MANKYGNTWWGQQWLQALNRIDNTNRLPRGRSYANKGAVREVKINGTQVSAQVQGTQPKPYQVKINVPPFSANQKARVTEVITENPFFLSKLLNRELPPELSMACQKNGVALFPTSWRDLHGACSCPDSAVPCKHLAAVLYLIANEIDKNPFLVFELHGFDLFKALEGIGYTAAGQKEIYIPEVATLWGEFRPDVLLPVPDFELIINRLDFSQIPDCSEDLLRLLGEHPLFYPSADFKVPLQKTFRNVAKALNKTTDIAIANNTEPSFRIEAVDEIEILLDGELDFLRATLRDARGKSIERFEALENWIAWLEALPPPEVAKSNPTLQGLHLAYRLANRLAIHGAFIPQLLRTGPRHYCLRWIPAMLNEQVREVLRAAEAVLPKQILFYKDGKNIHQASTADASIGLLSSLLSYFVHAHSNLGIYDDDKVMSLFFAGTPEKFDRFEEQEYPAAIQLWLGRLFIADKAFAPMLQIEDEDDGFEVKIAVENKAQPLETPIPLSDLFEQSQYNHLRFDILRDLSILAEHFPKLSQLIASGGQARLVFQAEAFVEVLFKILPIIKLFGIRVSMPKALQKILRPQVSLAMESEENGIVKLSSVISLENILRFQWQIALGNEHLSPEAFLRMVTQFSGIVKWRDQYIYFDEKEIKTLIDKLENPPALNAGELLQTALTGQYQGAPVKLDKHTRHLMDELLQGQPVEPPTTLQAQLRPYQLRGYQWLYKNARLGFGSLIADDMGLGKTLQVIALLLKLKEAGDLGEPQKALVVVPTTLLTNWDREIKKFAPELRAHVYHGPARTLEPLANAEVLITTYGVLRSTKDDLNKQKWLLTIIDEAQNIKNPTTAQTKIVKKIKAPLRIAMSGTPVENRLSEYWSIFDFINQGYLGKLSKFKDDFAKPIEIERDQQQLERFRKVTSPFILRRVKTDKSVIQDLPDKIEKDQYCQLTAEQTALYQSVVENTMQDIEQTEGINRRGLILKLITALKQICNHPAHFLKKGPTAPALSGKCVLLYDLLHQLLDSGEKALIFTQYQEMGKLLATMIETDFWLEAPFLHGGVSRKERDEMVEDFQHNRATRLLLLSLKAGGTGLNLTAASNVIHFDLWWNPAVEAQATDRAFRIGQTNNVLVHRFITQNTFEEKINKLLLNKRELADLTVASGEQWIGELSNADLRELIKLH
ncbi:MAG TPA: SNF2-related protein [Saprospiraceae bacterium]|nr:SNF2-related protein [Saprospiraceae bacterium]HMP24195.1 SNF2-related protein [Saprospiraceae bacterium]